MKKAIALICLALLFAGCAMKPMPSPSYAPVSQYAGGENQAGANLSAGSNERLVISTATLHIESLEPDSVHARVIDMATKYNGYVLNAEHGVTSIRIPATGFHDAIKEIELLGKVKDENITGQDVTDDFRDYQTRLDNAEKTRQRYLALLDMAHNIDEILKVERELERLNTDIEFLKGKIDRLSHLVQYSTITVRTINEVRPGPVGYLFYGIYTGIKWLFVWD
jgi:hypothetical protein